MPEDREDKIWEQIKERARDLTYGYGEVVIKLKVHENKVSGGEVEKVIIKLG